MSDNVLEKLLEAIDTETGRALLSDLRDDDRRSPQLYNAIGKYLERHKFTIAKLKPDESLLGDLAAALNEFPELGEDELYGDGVRH
ncbi:DNA packaging/maturation protein A [Pseudomonas phage gh-1]|uniref:DNA packaging protein small subunit n=12 Tax=Ghunavirus TaxID=2732683 RepID=A0A1W6JRV8_9CAUD|nr:terminase small subunit [Pseudomonas phage gh-1]YP_009043272.1 terminase small subunit [Pseudomonas phage phiPSA2]YP_009784790.1 terminase small subunit [Pseudomonas phage phiPsa17]YP_009790481.1 terminase small subunit [Pseudomonas phage WRT]YP_009790531.1 terminase small subunit [Pseudomonas phage KNP]YP_009793779.1 terminase small subunit [Pseudomonas phage Pf1 ERZ-2017]QHB47899.1 DNA packaging protein small subunit [Pseudomonas phage CHF1]QHB47960.1 DNA packaging protein small subunit